MKLQSLNKNFQFLRAYRSRKCYVSPLFVTYVVSKKGGGVRLGITTGKKVGCAVRRSRARRVIREAFRPCFPLVGGYDIVFVARTRTPEMKSTTLIPVVRRHLTEMGVITDG